MTKTPTPISFKSVNARDASEVPFQFEVLDPDGSGSGIVLGVLGGHSKAVTAEVNHLLNERRSIEATAALNARTGGRKPAAYTTVESDIEFGQRLAAVRLVSWSFAEDCTPQNALEFLQTNPDIADQVAEKSSNMGNFMKTSSPS